jgi:4-hydroxythreonine-4-phosphate dehydrogenase
MQERKIRVAITQGDTNGIGYEVILKTFLEPEILELCTPIIYGSPKLAAYHAKALGVEPQFNVVVNASDAKENRVNLLNCFGEEDIKVDLGMPTPEAGAAAQRAIDKAIEDYGTDAYDVLVTAPVCKNSIPSFNGHSDYLAQRIGQSAAPLTILLSEDLRVALVTNNVAIKDVAEAITKQKIVEKAQLLHQSLRRDLRVNNPRIAVLALNPRCGEDGVLGNEEQEIIAPAVEELAAAGIQAFGPYAADDFFSSAAYMRFDAVLAMYHDQGLAPFKSLTPGDGVRFTAGLPLVRTAPAHGIQYDIAGKDKADERSFRHAIFKAIDIWRNRQDYDEPMGNPLPKLYHEKRDDSEKVRFRSEKPMPKNEE